MEGQQCCGQTDHVCLASGRGAHRPGTEANWEQPPFSGVIKDGFIWGRGAWDNKGNLMSQLEAAEQLVAAGFKPERTVYFYPGADEEVGGLRGAVATAKP